MAQEIERKFLAHPGYKAEASRCERICQGYLSSVPERTVRVRVKGGRAYLTVKGASDPAGVSRYEWEHEIPVPDALELLQLCEPGRIDKTRLCEGDTVVVLADDSFVDTWGESSVFLMIANGHDSEPHSSCRKRTFTLFLLVLMIVGATVGELPWFQETFPGLKLDMFFFAAVTAVAMAWANIFPARKYTKYISWDILITIACAFAISKAMTNSGMADLIAKAIIDLSYSFGPKSTVGPYILLGALYLISNVITALITNNAAAALGFPLALSLATQLGVSPMPFFIAICISASADFSTPIGYQTNLIVQGIGNYKFMDFVRVGLPLNLLCMVVSVLLIPQFWPFDL